MDSQADDDIKKVLNALEDIMKELWSVRKWVPSHISLVKMSLGMMENGIW